jgi:hypothetical protein
LAVAATAGAVVLGHDDADEARRRNDSSSEEWLNVGKEAERAMADLKDPMTGKPLPPDGYSPPMLSDPVDILRPGTFTFSAGPLPKGTTARNLGFGLPPDSGEMLVFSMGHQSRIEKRDDGRYAVTTVDVSEVKRPYYDLRMWFMWGLG